MRVKGVRNSTHMQSQRVIAVGDSLDQKRKFDLSRAVCWSVMPVQTVCVH